MLSPTAAPAPTVIAQTGWHLWQQGVLGSDLDISLLHRALVGFALGLSVSVITGVLGGLLRSGEHLFNGIVQIFNTIPVPGHPAGDDRVVRDRRDAQGR